MSEVKLSERERVVLFAMCDSLPEEHGAPFKAINSYVRIYHPDSGKGCETWNIRRVVRALKRKGMTEYMGALFDESDGRIMGSGYGVTEAGREWFRRNAT